MIRILAVDDEKNILKLIKNALGKDGYEVTTACGFEEIPYERLPQYDLILLDVMMPGIDGFEVCKKIRNQVDCPILFLTAKNSEADIIQGLFIGGDDYLKKPFGIGELRARVTAHLRREQRERKHIFTIGNVQFNLSSMKAVCGEKNVPLTKSEYAISEYLAVNHGQVFSKDRIFEQVFGYDKESDSSVIVEHIKNIRAKFIKAGEEPIETAWGIGYKWK